jgi:DNA-binding transcriptional regulator LsrR (DeoR family)
MTRKRCTGKALAERRRRAVQLQLAGFTQEEIADKLDMVRTVVCRDLQSAGDARRSGDSPRS